MNAVMLRRDWPAGFQRAVRDERGNVLRLLRFVPGEIVMLEAEEYAAVQSDIGKALELPRKSAAPQENPAPRESGDEEQVLSTGRRHWKRK